MANDNSVYCLKPLDMENVSDYFATVGALACMMADAYEDAYDGKYEDAMQAMSLVNALCSGFENKHLTYLFGGMSAAIAKEHEEQIQWKREG